MIILTSFWHVYINNFFDIHNTHRKILARAPFLNTNFCRFIDSVMLFYYVNATSYVPLLEA